MKQKTPEVPSMAKEGKSSTSFFADFLSSLINIFKPTKKSASPSEIKK